MKTSKSVRLSISLPEEYHKAINVIAEAKRVSLAWVVRDAIDIYLERESPLFGVEGFVAEAELKYGAPENE